MRLTRLLLSVLVLALVLSGTAVAERVVYNKYNIHTQFKKASGNTKICHASYANYTNPGAGHIIVPVGTQLTVEDIGSKEIVFHDATNDIRIRFELHEPRMGVSAEQYLELITSPAPVSLSSYGAADKKGIEAGKASVGMTRKGVMAALGYPAAHATPGLDSDMYTYWTNRFGKVVVFFDAAGKVKEVRD